MNQIAIFLCSPHKGGVTDTLAYNFCEGAKVAGAYIKIYAVRDYKITPCIGCGQCNSPPHSCIFDGDGDQSEELFDALRTSSLCLFSIPIYFYAMPAHFKAFIDRGQRFWGSHFYNNLEATSNQAAIAILSAGRLNGRLLFSATLRTLRYFLKIFNIPLKEWKTLRGADTFNRLPVNNDVQKQIVHFGKKWGKKVLDNKL